MRETPEELNELQALLDASLSRSTDHLRSIALAYGHTESAIEQSLASPVR